MEVSPGSSGQTPGARAQAVSVSPDPFRGSPPRCRVSSRVCVCVCLVGLAGLDVILQRTLSLHQYPSGKKRDSHDTGIFAASLLHSQRFHILGTIRPVPDTRVQHTSNLERPNQDPHS